jgi:hypothetical protein
MGHILRVRPVLANNETGLPDPVTIWLQLYLIQIADLEERKEILHTKARLKISWFDPRLTWNSDNYGGMAKIKVNSTLLWKPDIVLHNSVTGNFKTTEQGHHYKSKNPLIRVT